MAGGGMRIEWPDPTTFTNVHVCFRYADVCVGGVQVISLYAYLCPGGDFGASVLNAGVDDRELAKRADFATLQEAQEWAENEARRVLREALEVLGDG